MCPLFRWPPGRICVSLLAGCTWSSCLLREWLQRLPVWLSWPHVHLHMCPVLWRPTLVACLLTRLGCWCHLGAYYPSTSSPLVLLLHGSGHVSWLARWYHWYGSDLSSWCASVTGLQFCQSCVLMVCCRCTSIRTPGAAQRCLTKTSSWYRCDSVNFTIGVLYPIISNSTYK